MLVLDKLNLPEGDRRVDSLIKTYINEAYIYLSKYDTDVNEIELEMQPNSSVVQLPKNYLSMKKIIHPVDGVLGKDDFKIVNNRLILNSYLVTDGIIKVIISLVPRALEKDSDEPKINRKYHIGLVYYALFLYTDDTTYWQMFQDASVDLLMQDASDDLDSGFKSEYVKDIYFVKDYGDVK